MAMDSKYGADITETVEASLANLLQPQLPSVHHDLIEILANSIDNLFLQPQVLDRLPIYPPSLAVFRQNVAKRFFNIVPEAPLSVFLECLQHTFPFNEVKRDLSNDHARKIKYAILVFDIAISHPGPDDAPVTQRIVRELQNMHTRIVDGRAAFLERTETKEVILRCWMRLDKGMHSRQTESLNKYLDRNS